MQRRSFHVEGTLVYTLLLTGLAMFYEHFLMLKRFVTLFLQYNLLCQCLELISIPNVFVQPPRVGAWIFFFFLGLHPWHIEVPRLGAESELQLPATGTAM